MTPFQDKQQSSEVKKELQKSLEEMMSNDEQPKEVWTLTSYEFQLAQWFIQDFLTNGHWTTCEKKYECHLDKFGVENGKLEGQNAQFWEEVKENPVLASHQCGSGLIHDEIGMWLPGLDMVCFL